MKLGLEEHSNESVHNMILTWPCPKTRAGEALERIEGAAGETLDVRLRGDYHFCAVIPELNGSVLNVSVQPSPIGSLAYAELLLFGTAGEKATDVETEWKAKLATLFPESAASQA
jgi:hypothetical protein